MIPEDGTLDLFSVPPEEPEPEPEEPPAPPPGAADPVRREEPRIWTVSELNTAVRELLEGALPPLWVGGEVANWSRARSGHCYFTLKDEGAQLRAVLFRRDAMKLPLDPENGLRVQVFGTLTLYEARGEFQLVARMVRTEEGEGLWRLAFERLKAKLESEGLLAPERKRRLPPFPRTVGVVTSPTGAALRDILTVIQRRAPWTRVVVRGTRVQGAGAAEEVARAIRTLGASGLADVLIVGRGGGSVEDLWAFNEEPVARAIASSPVPVISAVGHETDVMISDLVADSRAPTPSAAGEAAVQDGEAIVQLLQDLRPRLVRGLRGRVEQRARALIELRRRISRGGRDLVAPRIRAVDQQRDRMERAIASLIGPRRQALSVAAGRVEALSPLGTLRRGYAVPLDPSGQVLRSTREFQVGEPFSLRVVDGRVRCRPLEIEHEEGDDG